MTRINEHGQPVGDPVPGWSKRPRPGPVTLDGRYVRLEPLTVTLAQEAFGRLAPHPELWTYLADDPRPTWPPRRTGWSTATHPSRGGPRVDGSPARC